MEIAKNMLERKNGNLEPTPPRSYEKRRTHWPLKRQLVQLIRTAGQWLPTREASLRSEVEAHCENRSRNDPRERGVVRVVEVVRLVKGISAWGSKKLG